MLVLAACDPAPSTSTSETSGATPEDGTAGGDDSGSTPDPSAGTTGPTGTTADAGAPKKDGGAKDGGAEAGTSCSTCASELVASDPLNVALYGGAWYIAVDGTNVYIARNTATKIARVPKTGGTLVPYTIAATGDILALAEADDFLYFVRHDTSGGHVDKLPKAGGTPTTLFTAYTSSIDWDNLAVSDGLLWFAYGSGRDIRSIDLATDAVSAPRLGGGWLGVNTTHLFWMNSSKLMAAPKDGSSAPAEIAFLGTIPRGIWARNDAVFVGTEGEIEITKIATASPHTETKLNTAVDLSQSYERPTPSYVDGTYAYVVARSALEPGIYRVPTAGGPAELFATDAEPLALTGDATHVYWTNRDHEVRRKAK